MSAQGPPTDPLVAMVNADTRSIRSTATETNDIEKGDVHDEESSAVAARPQGSLGRQTAFANLGKKDTFKLFWRPLMYCGFALFGVMMDGFQMSLPGSIVANRGFINQFGTLTNPTTGLPALNAAYLSYWALALSFAAFGVQFLNGPLSDRYGRRSVLWAMTVALVVGLFVEMFARNWWHWLISKILMGLGQGMCQHGVLTYMGELAPTQIRGSVISTYAWGWCFGQLLAGCTLYAVNKITPLVYLNAIYAEWIPLGIWILLLPFFPESPWWYARNDKPDQAKKVMSRLYKGIVGYNIDYEYDVMLDRIAEEKAKSADNVTIGWLDIVKGNNWRRLLAGIFCVNQQALNGMNIIFGQTTYFFQQIGLPEPFQANVIVYSILMTGIAGSLYTIERFGRRTLILTASCILICINTIIASIGFMPETSSTQSATLALICIWVFSYACGLSGSCWSAPAEVATMRLRAKSISAILMTNALSNVLYGSTVPLMLSKDGGAGTLGWGVKTLYLFVGLGTTGLVLNFFFLPETKGRSYHELDEMYDAGIAPRKMSRYITQIEQSGEKQHR